MLTVYWLHSSMSRAAEGEMAFVRNTLAGSMCGGALPYACPSDLGTETFSLFRLKYLRIWDWLHTSWPIHSGRICSYQKLCCWWTHIGRERLSQYIIKWKSGLQNSAEEDTTCENECVCVCAYPWLHTDINTAAAKSLQSCPTLCDPIDGSPPGSPVPGILQVRTLEWVAISFSNAWKWKVKVKLLSRIQLLVTPWTTSYQVPPSMGFSRQKYWSGVPLPSPDINTNGY